MDKDLVDRYKKDRIAWEDVSKKILALRATSTGDRKSVV